jgi:hypothetical protein
VTTRNPPRTAVQDVRAMAPRAGVRTDPFKRGQLVDACGADRPACDQRPLRVPGERVDVGCADQSEQPVGDEPVPCPGGQVAAEEHPGRDKAPSAPAPFAAHPREKECRRRNRGQHHRRHHRHPDAEEPAERTEVGAGACVHAAHPRDGHRPGRERRYAKNRRQPDGTVVGAATAAADTRSGRA